MTYQAMKNLLERRSILTRERKKIYEMKKRMKNGEARGVVKIEADGERYGVVESVDYMSEILENLRVRYQKGIDDIDGIIKHFSGDLEEDDENDEWIRKNVEEEGRNG